MRILLLGHSFNSLTQRLHAELIERGHRVSVELHVNDTPVREAVASFQPEIIVVPFLKRAIPEDVRRACRCLVIHPGIVGDRGPSALGWAILEGERHWGVTVLEAEGETDAGPVWASISFPMRATAKSSLYRREVTDAAVEAVLTALARFQSRAFIARRPHAADPTVLGRTRPPCREADREIDWINDSTDSVLRKIRSADGTPGVRDELYGHMVRLYDAHEADNLVGRPGEIIARCGGALARATRDGAVWLGHVREDRDKALKLPATYVFSRQSAVLPERTGYEPIRYWEEGPVGFLQFAFYNGAMGTAQCKMLRAAYAQVLARPTRVVVLMGGPDYWSNGMHLGLIEAADNPADESWRNLNAMNDLVRDIITTTDRLVISALRGNAGAGGVFFAMAADEVWAQEGVILNPHYKNMGNLYGSEYWTYLLPRRAARNAFQITRTRLPMGVAEAQRLGLVNRVMPASAHGDPSTIASMARMLAGDPRFEMRVADKRRRRTIDEAHKPLEAYRNEELRIMRLNFYGSNPSYHVARYNFIHKIPRSRTPATPAPHRSSALTVSSSAMPSWDPHHPAPAATAGTGRATAARRYGGLS